ncbi:MAG: hypothetical protein ACR2J5_03185 [Geodermatophilaceae bacterium]
MRTEDRSASSRSKIALFVGAAVLIGTILMGASPASAGPSAPPKGLMIQVSTLQGTPPATLKMWLEDIRKNHHKRSPGHINAVVLQDIADSSGALYTAYLDVIAPYLPGGATPIFTRAYVGTVDLAWTGAGSKYIEGIEDASFRTQNINISRTAASAFTARYPKVSTDWYITYEANLSGFWDARIEGAYKTYISELMKTLTSVRANKAFLWSPAFWTMYADEPSWAMPDLTTNLTHLFTGLPTRLTLDIQDFVGQSGGSSSMESAVSWVRYLKQNWGRYLSKVQMNAEQFRQAADGTISVADPAEVTQRENYYYSQSIELGPAWEIRYWHQRLYGN